MKLCSSNNRCLLCSCNKGYQEAHKQYWSQHQTGRRRHVWIQLNVMTGVGNGNPLQYSCLENYLGQRSLVGHRTWGCKELDRTEHTCRVMMQAMQDTLRPYREKQAGSSKDSWRLSPVCSTIDPALVPGSHRREGCGRVLFPWDQWLHLPTRKATVSLYLLYLAYKSSPLVSK